MPVLIDEETQQAYSWDQPDATIGRTPDNTVQIRLPGISRKHCRIAFHNGRYVLADLDSKNGTILDGRPVKEKVAPLQAGDVVNLGKRRLLFKESASRQVKPKPAAL